MLLYKQRRCDTDGKKEDNESFSWLHSDGKGWPGSAESVGSECKGRTVDEWLCEWVRGKHIDDFPYYQYEEHNRLFWWGVGGDIKGCRSEQWGHTGETAGGKRNGETCSCWYRGSGCLSISDCFWLGGYRRRAEYWARSQFIKYVLTECSEDAYRIYVRAKLQGNAAERIPYERLFCRTGFLRKYDLAKNQTLYGWFRNSDKCSFGRRHWYMAVWVQVLYGRNRQRYD